MVHRKYLKTIQSEENSFQVSRSFQTKEWSKTGWKRRISHRGCLMCHLRMVMRLMRPYMRQ